MGVDGISGGGPPRIPDAAPTSAASKEGSFEVGGTEATEGAASDIARVESGELSLDEYLDARVTRATAHLEAVLQPEQLDLVRESLREQLDVDPVVRNLVHRATGKSPP